MATEDFVLLQVHKRLKTRVFDKAIDVDATYPLEICLACAALNFALFTIAYVLPLRDLLVDLLPPLQAVSQLIPTSYQDLFRSPASTVWLFIPSALGPSIVYSVRWFRRDGSDRGDTIMELLQVLVYAAVLLALLCWLSPNSIPNLTLEPYWLILFLVLLPGTMGGVGMLLLLSSSRRKLPYIV